MSKTVPFQAIQFSISTQFKCKYTVYLSKTFLFQAIQFSWFIVKWFQVLVYNSHNLTSVICLHTVCSIWPIDRTLSDATTQGLGAMKEYFSLPKLPWLEPPPPSDGLMSYPGHSWGWGFIPPQRGNRCILQHLEPGLSGMFFHNGAFFLLVVCALAGCVMCCTVWSGVSHHWIYLWPQGLSH